MGNQSEMFLYLPENSEESVVLSQKHPQEMKLETIL